MKTTKLPSVEDVVEIIGEYKKGRAALHCEMRERVTQRDHQAYTRLVEIVQEHIWPGEGNKHTNDVLNAIKDKIDTVYGKE